MICLQQLLDIKEIEHCMANIDVVLCIIIIIIIISGRRTHTGGSSCSPGAHLPPGSQGCSPGQDCAAGWSWRILSLWSEHETSKNTSCWSWSTSEIILHSVSVMITVLLIQKRIETMIESLINVNNQSSSSITYLIIVHELKTTFMVDIHRWRH